MMNVTRPLTGTADLRVFPLCLGGNVFGWTVDKEAAFGVLDAYAAAGGNFVDTADQYVFWVNDTLGGESESIIGSWMTARGNRDQIVVATKVGGAPGVEGLAAKTIRRGVEASLKRLGTDRIDLYYAHFDDRETPLEETLTEFDALVREGKVRYIGASNYEASRLAEALSISDDLGLARFVAVQPHYNLVERGEYEGELAQLCAREKIDCVPYHALAHGFLTGKYRAASDAGLSPRGGTAVAYLERNGSQVLDLLDEIAREHETTVAAIALAWLAAQPTVRAPITSVSSPEQLDDLLSMVRIDLSDHELGALGHVTTADGR